MRKTSKMWNDFIYGNFQYVSNSIQQYEIVIPGEMELELEREKKRKKEMG